MQRHAFHASSACALALSTLAAALLAACGGGGSDSSSATMDTATATTYAANSAQIGSDTMRVADGAVLAAQAMIAAGAGVSPCIPKMRTG